MKYGVTGALALLAAIGPAMQACAKEESKIATLEVTLGGIKNGGPIPEKFAFCQPDGHGKTRDGDNISPEISWRGAPEGTQSFALVMVDRDVPANFDPANKPGVTIAENAQRQSFYHWTVTEIPATLLKIPEGKAGVGLGRKPPGKVEFGMTGKNDFSRPVPGGLYGGYDGPCPPWNDMRLHHYRFIVYALDVPALAQLRNGFDGKMIEQSVGGHVLAKGEVVGTFSNNPDVRGK